MLAWERSVMFIHNHSFHVFLSFKLSKVARALFSKKILSSKSCSKARRRDSLVRRHISVSLLDWDCPSVLLLKVTKREGLSHAREWSHPPFDVSWETDNPSIDLEGRKRWRTTSSEIENVIKRMDGYLMRSDGRRWR
jgi:hypothetical protein